MLIRVSLEFLKQSATHCTAVFHVRQCHSGKVKLIKVGVIGETLKRCIGLVESGPQTVAVAEQWLLLHTLDWAEASVNLALDGL